MMNVGIRRDSSRRALLEEIGNGIDDNDQMALSFCKLPQILNLSILKLDGSSFAVQIVRTASVFQLKEAIEDLFNRSSECRRKISWENVWGHFCLHYKGQNLVDNNASVWHFGIKDGDQLSFIRHFSMQSNAEAKLHKHLKRSKKTCKNETQGVTYDESRPNQREKIDKKNNLQLEQLKRTRYLKGWLIYTSVSVFQKLKNVVKTRSKKASALRLGQTRTEFDIYSAF